MEGWFDFNKSKNKDSRKRKRRIITAESSRGSGLLKEQRDCRTLQEFNVVWKAVTVASSPDRTPGFLLRSRCRRELE